MSKKRNSTPERGKKDQIDGEKKTTFDLSEKEMNLCPETSCPICLDHPHNPVLLICSSHRNGCRPFMCDTGDLLSNCFSQFCKLHSVIPSDSGGNPNSFAGSGESGRKRVFGCPLCRGEITGWIVVESARRLMNELVRNCSVDCCEYSGNYSDLKKHAESQHPETRLRDEVAEVAQDDEFDWADHPAWDEGEFDGVDDLIQHVDFDGTLYDPDWEEGEIAGVDDLLIQHVDFDEVHIDGNLLQHVDFDDWEEINEGIRLESLLDTIQFDC